VFYLENYAIYERIYGALTSVIVLLAWTYMSGMIVIIGAEVSSEYQRMRLGQSRGQSDRNPRPRR
jgi:membrane protein